MRFGRGRSSERGAGLRRGGRGGKKVDFVGNGAAKVSEGFTDIWRVVVGFIGVLGASWWNYGSESKLLILEEELLKTHVT